MCDRVCGHWPNIHSHHHRNQHESEAVSGWLYSSVCECRSFANLILLRGVLLRWKLTNMHTSWPRTWNHFHDQLFNTCSILFKCWRRKARDGFGSASTLKSGVIGMHSCLMWLRKSRCAFNCIMKRSPRFLFNRNIFIASFGEFLLLFFKFYFVPLHIFLIRLTFLASKRVGLISVKSLSIEVDLHPKHR